MTETPEYTKDEALAFIEAMRLTVAGRTGFKWMVEKLAALAAYVEAVGTENETLNAYLDDAGLRQGYDAYQGDATGHEEADD
jgi:hypothetical protein